MGKRINKITIRLSPEEYKYFLAVQRNSGLSQADFLMKAVDLMVSNKKMSEQNKDVHDQLDEIEN